MKKIILVLFLLSTFIKAENFSEMSTQELIAIMGFVKSSEISSFKKELQLRVSTMNNNEKKQYLKNRKKNK